MCGSSFQTARFHARRIDAGARYPGHPGRHRAAQVRRHETAGAKLGGGGPDQYSQDGSQPFRSGLRVLPSVAGRYFGANSSVTVDISIP